MWIQYLFFSIDTVILVFWAAFIFFWMRIIHFLHFFQHISGKISKGLSDFKGMWEKLKSCHDSYRTRKVDSNDSESVVWIRCRSNMKSFSKHLFRMLRPFFRFHVEWVRHINQTKHVFKFVSTKCFVGAVSQQVSNYCSVNKKDSPKQNLTVCQIIPG